MIQLNLTLNPDQLVAVGIALGGQPLMQWSRGHDEAIDSELTAIPSDGKVTDPFKQFTHEVTFDQLETSDRNGNAVNIPVQTNPINNDLDTGAAVTLDADGMPWDARIHASTRATNADGRWKRRRGVDDVEVTRVEMEIGPRGQAVVPPPPPADTTVAPPVPPPTNRSTVTDFVGLMGAVTTKGIDMATLQAEVVAHGLNTIAELPARPDLVNSIATALGV